MLRVVRYLVVLLLDVVLATHRCVDADQTIEFMQAQAIPWIAFKTMAAGAIQPKAGFDYAFQNGADFIAAGMFDWQVVSNANTAIDVLAGVKDRKRPWCS